MTELTFFKYQGTGNDFIMIDDRNRRFPEADIQLIGHLCHRRFGIGADGIILIREHKSADFDMIYYNPDGSKSLCGNGSRCAVHLARYLGMIDSETSFMAIDGVHQAKIEGEVVHLKMNDVNEIKTFGPDLFIDTGSPHYIKIVEDVDLVEVTKEGRTIRNGPEFGSGGTNVNFIQKLDGNEVAIRTYERGVENETLSCGTGVTAAALAVGGLGMESPITVNARGGVLKVTFIKKSPNHFEDIFLIGPAEMVYQGRIEI